MFSGIIAQRFGSRRIAFLGALLMFTSMCASSFVKTLPLLYLTYGFIPGMYLTGSFIIKAFLEKLSDNLQKNCL